LEDQAALQIFTMPESQVLSEQAREYLQLRRDEELIKIRLRVASICPLLNFSSLLSIV
jgi:hypothetical protein